MMKFRKIKEDNTEQHLKEKKEILYSTKKYILLTVLSVLGVFVLTSLLLICMTLRYYVKTAAIPQAVEAVVLENIQVSQPDGSEKSLAQYILDEYIQDERITVEEVQEVLHEGTFSDFAVILAEKYNQYLTEGGEFPEIEAQEFVQLLEENTDLIYEKTGLRFLDPDKKKLKENLNHPLDTLNHVLESYMYKGVKGFFFRMTVSFWIEIVLALLLGLALAWMIIIFMRKRKKIGTAFKVYSMTAVMPCTIVFMGGLLMSWLMELIHLPAELGSALRGKTVVFSGIGILICIVLFCFGMLWNLISAKPAVSSAVPEIKPAFRSKDMPAPLDHTQPLPAIPETPKRQFCRFCGKKLVSPDALFCYRCGKAQDAEHLLLKKNS